MSTPTIIWEADDVDACVWWLHKQGVRFDRERPHRGERFRGMAEGVAVVVPDEPQPALRITGPSSATAVALLERRVKPEAMER